jgi:hypothetical protein
LKVPLIEDMFVYAQSGTTIVDGSVNWLISAWIPSLNCDWKIPWYKVPVLQFVPPEVPVLNAQTFSVKVTVELVLDVWLNTNGDPAI